MKVKQLRVATASDLHLGHARNETKFIIQNLRAAFPDDAATAELDMIVLVGDVFDGLLSLPDEIISEIDFWIIDLLRLCKKHDIVLRVLEGTPSHDWKQSQRFITLNEGARIECDLKYVKTLDIEHIDKFGIDVLYIPDEWDESTDETLRQVRELLSLKGLTKVDFAFMHGQFEHQLPPIVKAPKHNAQAYLELVRYLIFIGHVHIFSQFDRILAQGSFDRLSHGEEMPKGHIRATVRDEDDFDITFVENTSARKFVTIDCQGLEIDEALAEIETYLNKNKIPEDSFVRIACSAGHPLLLNMEILIKRWPLYTWSKLIKTTETEQRTISDDELADETFVPITITSDNIVELVMDRLRRRNTPEELIGIARHAMTELK